MEINFILCIIFIMLCPCCIVPLILQFFGIIVRYEVYILILIIQVIFLYINKTKWKKEQNNIHIYLAIIINIVTLLCVYFNFINYGFLKNILISLNLINIFVGFYRNKNITCKDNSCNHKH
jgi:hypothetical protein